MFISIHFYFSLCSIWPPCACITIIRCFDHLLLILNAYCREWKLNPRTWTKAGLLIGLQRLHTQSHTFVIISKN